MTASHLSCTRCQTPLPPGAAFCPACGHATPTGYTTAGQSAGAISEVSLDRLRTRLADRYAIERELGRGGMAVVYLAHDERHNRRVAIKVLLPEIAVLLGPARFLREIEITAQLQHPNIVPVHDSGNVDGTLYYVMPYVEGESLRARLARTDQLPVDEVLRIVREAGDALGYAHDQGIIHRDIKPENILLSAGHAQVADFGIARAVSAAGGETLTKTGAIVGTPAYMAPEQAAGLPDVDGRADLYALAAVAHEALVGNRSDPMAAARTSENILTSTRPDVKPPLARALSAPLALERELRPGSVEEWFRALDRARPGTGQRPWRWAALGVVAVFIAVIAYLCPIDGPLPLPPPTERVVAVLISTSGSPPDGLEALLRDAVEQKLLYVPAEVVRDTAAATELLLLRASVSQDDQVRLEARATRKADRREIGQGGPASGSLDDVLSLVNSIIRDLYDAEGGLPRTPETWSVYRQADTLMRSARYREAVRQFERVIEREPSYAPAHFKKMLTELLDSRPTRAITQVRSALDAARVFADSLDPVNRDLLRGYVRLIGHGDLDSALRSFQAIVDRNRRALDAWFVLGFLKVNFAGLLGQDPTLAKAEFNAAYEVDSTFAAVLPQLVRIAYLDDRSLEAQQYTERYLAIDSTSPTAEILRLADSAATASASERIELMNSLRDRPLGVLEYVAMTAGAVEQSYQDRLGSLTAIEDLEVRAATAEDRRVAFRMRMAFSLGTARWTSAGEALDAARGRGVPPDEIDAWLLLPAVTLDHRLAAEAEIDAAASRLADREDDPTATWLAARWYRTREPARHRRMRDRLAALTDPVADTTPLARGLHMDLQAQDLLARGDTADALAQWREAFQRYDIGEVMFGLLGSLWPLRLDVARVAFAAGDYQGALAVIPHFRYPAGFVDQVAWPAIWPLAAAASSPAGDPLRAREIAQLVEPVFRDADGAGTAVRDSIRAILGLSQ